jgi:type VI secretion system secreted protein VgrG
VVTNDHYTQVKNNQHTLIEGESRSKVTLDQTEIIEGSLQQTVGTLAMVEAGEELYMKSGGTVVLDAGPRFTMKSGKSFINIDENGINIVGAMIEVNTGGAAAIGTAFAGEPAELPLGEELPAPNDEEPAIVPVQQRQTIIAAANEGTAICQECQEAAEAS